MLCWLDLETEDLDPRRCLILELGLVLTDDDLKELGRASWVLHLSRERQEFLEPVVRDMHRASNLLDECAQSELTIDDVEDRALTFLSAYDVPRGEVPLCGSTIGFDRSFLAEHAPALLRYFYYRSIDVSTLTELARRWQPEVYAKRPGANDSKPHRALDDLEYSIACLKHYRHAMLRDRASAAAWAQGV